MQAQQTLDSFRDNVCDPVLPTLAGKTTTKLRQDLARLQGSLSPCTTSQTFLAVYDSPSTQTTHNRRQFFCEACAVHVPAREQDWQMHISGTIHQCQVLSLMQTGELGHLPSGSFKFCKKWVQSCDLAVAFTSHYYCRRQS